MFAESIDLLKCLVVLWWKKAPVEFHSKCYMSMPATHYYSYVAGINGGAKVIPYNNESLCICIEHPATLIVGEL